MSHSFGPLVLRVLKTDESRLFPAKNLIKPVVDAVAREQEPELIEKIVKAGSNPVVVHAAGGVGKSVFATRIGLGLPQGSISILYDCFGNGQYRSVSGYRHRHKDALVALHSDFDGLGRAFRLARAGVSDQRGPRCCEASLVAL